MHPYLENRMAIGRAVVYFAQAARTFSAGIKCRHCMCVCGIGRFKEKIHAIIKHRGERLVQPLWSNLSLWKD